MGLKGLVEALGSLAEQHPAIFATTTDKADVAGLAQEVLDSRNANKEYARIVNLRRQTAVTGDNIELTEMTQTQ